MYILIYTHTYIYIEREEGITTIFVLTTALCGRKKIKENIAFKVYHNK